MSVLPTFSQPARRLLIILPVVFVTLLLLTGLFNHESFRSTLPTVVMPKVVITTNPSSCAANQTSGPLDNLSSIIQALYAPLVVPITTPTFTTRDGTVKRLPPASELIHHKSLGKRICILDVDTRPHTGAGGVFSSSLPTWDALSPASAGFLSHYLYALIHGYTYKFVQAPTYQDRAPHWTKVIFTQELLKKYDIVVMMDYDAVFPSPELPLEWMLNYWKIDDKVMVAMAEDPNAEVNRDQRGNLNVNTGFIIAQASENTQRMFKDWAECPSETRYKGCAEWKGVYFHEQSGFSSHVRYDFLDGLTIAEEPGKSMIRALPCNEANGIPEKKNLGCTGQLVRHHWGGKELAKREFNDNIMNAMLPLLIQSAFKGGDATSAVADYRNKTLVGDQILDKPL
ncbi:hypothetical protein NEUTE1DRAFT_118000 [Neurospora tetrasperma FGSC 2508]|uniref:Nucleotide-diphospho-sugar transferase domain-containing protein n=1 Tax=Neurospora tetrasperma (strain FGSC 2508 / ATCC MYA-4615 / P0657) TaxID=510951 RepID=F8MV90_NEUT8|nr:uncharacterized protein NEUTE1DRAFT_118000 [Neurospora tetrasperma FGSC 2508]EGO53895.1 hypothetical protein NEUTE1DRAFT_118000 [Neurospora tetrasperma FGSC 2508]EGZ68693.1 hypothetical protein NEUTE2DRAFT_160952 [Neurospora tetrasperma FGSC 2509]